MKQLSQLGATAKGLPLQIIKLRRGNPFEASNMVAPIISCTFLSTFGAYYLRPWATPLTVLAQPKFLSCVPLGYGYFHFPV